MIPTYLAISVAALAVVSAVRAAFHVWESARLHRDWSATVRANRISAERASNGLSWSEEDTARVVMAIADRVNKGESK